jgi:hypothetical protein
VIVAALLLAVQAVTPVAEPSAEDIVVTARRSAARRLRIVTKTDRRTGDIRSVFKRRSGDAALDAGMCAGPSFCPPPVTPDSFRGPPGHGGDGKSLSPSPSPQSGPRTKSGVTAWVRPWSPSAPPIVIPAKAGIQTRYRHASGRHVRGYGFPPSEE